MAAFTFALLVVTRWRKIGISVIQWYGRLGVELLQALQNELHTFGFQHGLSERLAVVADAMGCFDTLVQRCHQCQAHMAITGIAGTAVAPQEAVG